MIRKIVLPAALATCLVGTAAAPAAAKLKPQTFRVSIQGTQTFTQVDHEVAAPESQNKCFDARGDVVENTTVKFKSSRSILMRATPWASGGGYTWSVVKASDKFLYELPLTTTFTHNGIFNREVKNCTGVPDGKPLWQKQARPEEDCPSKTVSNFGSSLSSSVPRNGALTVLSGEDLPTPGGLFGPKCPFGDLSGNIIEMKGKLRPTVLFSSKTSRVSLQGKQDWDWPSPDGDYTKGSRVVNATLTFTRVGR